MLNCPIEVSPPKLRDNVQNINDYSSAGVDVNILKLKLKVNASTL